MAYFQFWSNVTHEDLVLEEDYSPEDATVAMVSPGTMQAKVVRDILQEADLRPHYVRVTCDLVEHRHDVSNPTGQGFHDFSQGIFWVTVEGPASMLEPLRSNTEDYFLEPVHMFGGDPSDFSGIKSPVAPSHAVLS